MSVTAAALVAALVLALVHVATPALRFLGGTPRSLWLSLAGGVSVAYVFVHLLPELAEGQREVSRALGPHGAVGGVAGLVGLGFAERHVYLIALAGLAAFYGLDKLAKRDRGQRAEGEGGTLDDATRPSPGVDPEAATSAGVFWIHIASFGLYNVLIGYLLLHREVPGLASLAFFAVAMALHFLVTDFGLVEDHKHRYRTPGRWLLVAALGVGVALGMATELSKAMIAVLVALLAGGVILNVLKEEVPSERQSRFWAFALGMAGYAALLLTL
jgi:hypothetical protein